MLFGKTKVQFNGPKNCKMGDFNLDPPIQVKLPYVNLQCSWMKKTSMQFDERLDDF